MISHLPSMMLVFILVVGITTSLSQADGDTPPSPAQDAALLSIVRGGASDYEIVRNLQEPESVREGAMELQRLIRASSSAQLPIVDDPTPGKKQIVVGAHAAAAAVGVTPEDLPADGFRMRVVGDNLYLVGADDDRVAFYTLNNSISAQAGSYFAVIEFAQRFIGARWFMPGPLGEEIPSRQTLSIPADLDLTIAPAFACREMHIATGSVGAKSGGPYFHGPSADEGVRWGRRLRMGNALEFEVQHGFWMWIPAEEPNHYTPRAYGQAHPEYFALVNGKRTNHYAVPGTHHGGQLCLSNPDVIRVCAENIMAYSERSGAKDFSLTANDGAAHCECDNCRAWDLRTDQDGQPILVDRFVRFANAVAELVTPNIPDATFGIYAYETTTPPVVELHPSLRVSEYFNLFPYRFASPKARQSMETDLRGWRQRASYILFSSYYTGDTANWLLPWSTIEAQGWLVKLMAEYPSSSGMRMTYAYGDDLAPMGLLGPDPWVLSQLLWDPSRSVAELTDEFYAGAFGQEAGAAIRQYFNVINQAMTRSINALPKTEKIDTFNFLIHMTYLVPTYARVRGQCRALIDQAVAAVANDDERYRWRVDRVARGWHSAELTLDAVAAANAARSVTGPQRQAAWAKAVDLGRQRQALIRSPESRFALAPRTTDHVDQNLSLGVVTEVPVGDRFILRLPSPPESVVIDGQLDEPAWQTAARTPRFRENYKNGVPRAATVALAFHRPEGLYVGFECDEPAMSELRVVDDPQSIWNGDVVELFLVPPGEATLYVQFLVNPNGTGKRIVVWRDPGSTESENAASAWEFAAAKHEKSWTVEIFIPWHSLGREDAPGADEEWYADFFRERYTGSQTELSAWSPTRSSFANTTQFGRIVFAR